MAVVANLIAQIGADLTQFRLGMNEVDARLAQTAVRARSSLNTAQSYREAAARAARDQGIALSQRAAIDFPALRQANRLAVEDARQVATRMAEVQQRAAAAAQSGIAASIRTTRAELRRVEVEANRAVREVARTETRIATATTRAGILERRAADLGQRRAGLLGRAGDVEDMNSAYVNFQQAYAARLAQNASEYRNRALTNIAGTALKGGFIAEVGLAAATIEGAKFNNMMLQAVHNTSLTGDAVKFMRTEIVKLGLESGAPLDKLVEGFREIENFGYGVKDTVVILREAMKGAILAGGDLGKMAEILGGTMKNFNIPVEHAANTMSFFVEVSRLSKGTVENFIKAMGPGAATAGAYKVSLGDLAMSYILFSRHQLDARRGMTQFINDVTKISAPSQKVINLLNTMDKRFGTSLRRDFSPTGMADRGLSGVIEDIDKQYQIMKKKMPTLRESNLFMDLVPTMRGQAGMGIFGGNIKQSLEITKELKNSVGDLTGYNNQYQESLKQVAQAMGRMQVMGTVLTSDISKAMEPAVASLVDWLDHLFRSWTALDEPQKQAYTNMVLWSGVALIAFGAAGKLAVGIASLSTAMSVLGVTAEQAATVGLFAGRMGLIGLAIAAGLAIKNILELQEVMDPKRSKMGSEGVSQTQFNFMKATGRPIPGQQDWDSTLPYVMYGPKAPPVPPPHVKTPSELAKEEMERNMRQAKADHDQLMREIFGMHEKVAGKDPMADMMEKQKKAKKTDWDRAMEEVHRKMEELAEAQFKLGKEGHITDVMWMEQTNVVLKHSKALRENLELAARKLDHDTRVKEATDAYKKAVEKLSEVTGKDGPNNYQRLQEFASEKEIAGMTPAQTRDLIARSKKRDLTKELTKAEEQYKDMLEKVNKPLEKQETVFKQTLDEVSKMPELMKAIGPAGAQILANQAQINHDRVEDAKLNKQAQIDFATEAYDAAKALAEYYREVDESVGDLNRQLMLATGTVEGRWKAAVQDLAKNNKDAFAVADPEELSFMVEAAAAAFRYNEAMQKQIELAEKKAATDKFVREGLRDLTTKVKDLGHGIVYTRAAWDSMDQKMKSDAKKLAHALSIKDKIQELAQGTEDIFMRMLSNIREHGFRSFFRDMLSMIDDLLFQMAAKFLANQLFQAILNLGANAGLMGLGGGGGGVSGINNDAGITPTWGAAGGGYVMAGRSIWVGEHGRELFTPDRPGSITPHGAGGGGDVHNWSVTIVTPDPQAFSRSKGQVGATLARELQVAHRRNG